MLTATLTAPPLTSDLQRRSRGNQEQSSRLQQQRSSLSQRSLEEETLERRLSQLRQRLWRKKAALQQDQQLVRVLVPVLSWARSWSRSQSVQVLALILVLGRVLGNGLGLDLGLTWPGPGPRRGHLVPGLVLASSIHQSLHTHTCSPGELSGRGSSGRPLQGGGGGALHPVSLLRPSGDAGQRRR